MDWQVAIPPCCPAWGLGCGYLDGKLLYLHKFPYFADIKALVVVVTKLRGNTLSICQVTHKVDFDCLYGLRMLCTLYSWTLHTVECWLPICIH